MVFRIQVLARVTGMRPVIGWPVRWLQSDSVAPLKIRERIKLRGLRLRRVLLLRRPSLECLLPSFPPCLPDDKVAGNVGGSVIGRNAALNLYDKDVCSPASVPPIAGEGD